MDSYVLSQWRAGQLFARRLPSRASLLPPRCCKSLAPLPVLGGGRSARLRVPIRPGVAAAGGRNGPGVSALRSTVEAENRGTRIGDRGGSTGTAPAGIGAGEGEFDPAAKPPFGLADVRAAIPKHCWVKDPWKSASYVARDVAVVLGLAAAAAHLNNWAVWPLYWFAQGTMFWALFVLGHDCGHGSFSNNTKLNSVVGHIVHSSILVPYHGWRISHRTHHQNHGHVEKDESWHPLPESLYRGLDTQTRLLRFKLPFPLLAFPLYLWARTPGKKGSHFHPGSDLFLPAERKDVLTSTACWTAMVALLAGLTCLMGPVQMINLYFMPFLIFVMWLDLVTYLHHHGHEQKLPWYRGKEWSYLRGGLTTLDRDYGWINSIHHDIGTHVIHHLFPQIPHYNLVEATEAARRVLGKYYREPEKSGPLPLHLIGDLARSLREDHFVGDTGDVVYYRTDPEQNRKK